MRGKREFNELRFFMRTLNLNNHPSTLGRVDADWAGSSAEGRTGEADG
jgi:hypothetical protein